MDAHDSDQAAKRGPGGRYALGTPRPPGSGRRKGQSLSAELRRQGDPELVASEILRRLADRSTSNRDFTELAKLYGDRTEGAPLRRSISMRMTASDVLPAGYDQLPPEGKRAALAEIRDRAVRGALPLLEAHAVDE